MCHNYKVFPFQIIYSFKSINCPVKKLSSGLSAWIIAMVNLFW